MVYYSLFVGTLDDDMFNYDFLNFDRVDFYDCLCIIKNLYLYPSKITHVKLDQYAFNENIDELSILLNSFKVTINENATSEPIFKLVKD